MNARSEALSNSVARCLRRYILHRNYITYWASRNEKTVRRVTIPGPFRAVSSISQGNLGTGLSLDRKETTGPPGNPERHRGHAEATVQPRV